MMRREMLRQLSLSHRQSMYSRVFSFSHRVFQWWHRVPFVTTHRWAPRSRSTSTIFPGRPSSSTVSWRSSVASGATGSHQPLFPLRLVLLLSSSWSTRSGSCRETMMMTKQSSASRSQRSTDCARQPPTTVATTTTTITTTGLIVTTACRLLLPT